MTEDVQTRLQSAFRYNADRVELHEPELRSERPRNPRNRMRAGLAAAACVLGLVGAPVLVRDVFQHGSGSAGSGGSARSYESRHWVLASVVHGGRMTHVPAVSAPSINFDEAPDSCAGDVPAGSGCLVMYDSINTVSASYRRTARGFVTGDGASTAIGSTDQTAIHKEEVAAIGSITGAAITASVDGRKLTLTTPTYILIFVDGGTRATSTGTDGASSAAPTTATR